MSDETFCEQVGLSLGDCILVLTNKESKTLVGHFEVNDNLQLIHDDETAAPHFRRISDNKVGFFRLDLDSWKRSGRVPLPTEFSVEKPDILKPQCHSEDEIYNGQTILDITKSILK